MTASDELRAAYLRTAVEVEVDGRLVSALEAIELLGPLWVITAWNPYSEALDLDTNMNRHRQLAEMVDALGATRWDARGTSPDGEWSEKSLAISGLDRAQIEDLADRFEQHAVFELRAGSLTVHGCTSDWHLTRELETQREAKGQQ